MEYKRGEIYEITKNNQNGSGHGGYNYALVVGNDERASDLIISVIILSDSYYEYSTQIICKSVMYANCGMVSFANKNRFRRYIRTATAEEMSAVDEKMCEALAIKAASVDNSKELAELQEKLKCEADKYNELKAYKDELLRENANKGSEIQSLKEELIEERDGKNIFDFRDPEELERLEKEFRESQKHVYVDTSEEMVKLQTERDLYKAQYEKLLETLIAR